MMMCRYLQQLLQQLQQRDKFAQVIKAAAAALSEERKLLAQRRGGGGEVAADEDGGNGASTQKLNPKLDRLKVSHFQALAEEGALEPGHEKCRWIRDAFDVEALASQMDENAQVELRTAIE